MQPILAAAAVYAFLLVMFRVMGRRTVAELTTFDFVLLLIISEATQAALVGKDASLTAACLAILTLGGLDIALSLVKRRFPRVGEVVDGKPLLIVENGKPLADLMYRARVDLDDVLTSARVSRGLTDLSQIRYAVLEQDGHISIIPREPRPVRSNDAGTGHSR